MGSSQLSVDEISDKDISEKLKSIGAKAVRWLTVEPVWRLYRRFGFRGALGGMFIVFFIAYLAIAMVLAIPWSIFSMIELASMDSLPQTAMLLALPVAGYSGYRAYSLVQTREKLFEYSERPTYENATEAFEYFDANDDVARTLATYTVADVMEENPGKLIKRANKDPEDAAYEVVDLLHDNDEHVRMNGAHAMVFMSRDFPEAVMQYRDDVFAAMKYPNSSIQSSAAIAAGNLAYYEPKLNEDVLEHLEPLCDDPDHELRQTMCTALAHVHHERAAELLNILAEDPNPSVREEAFEATQMQQQEQRVDVEVDPQSPF